MLIQREVLCLCHSYTQDQYRISKLLSQEVDFVSYCQAQAKKSCQKLKLDRDSIMAVKGFDIEEDNKNRT